MLYSKSFNQDLVKEAGGIISRLNLIELVTPVNFAKVKADWITTAKVEFTNPSFIYDMELLTWAASQRKALTRIRHHIETEVEPENPIEALILEILIKRINGAILISVFASSMLNKDDEMTAKLAKDIYGYPDSAQIIRAYDITTGDTPLPAIKSRFSRADQKKLKALDYNANEIGYWFKRAIHYYGIDDWCIEVGDQYSCIDVRDKNSTGVQTICIPASRRVDGLKLLELIGHEIENHLRSSENCRALVEDALGEYSRLKPIVPIIAKSDNELLYEGAAKTSDVAINGDSALPQPFAIIACDQASRGASFADVARVIYDRQLEMFSLDGSISQKKAEAEAIKRAWTATYRIMRGITNTGAGHCCFPKDYVYMCGYNLAQTIDPLYLEFSSMEIDELAKMRKVFKLAPHYRNLDAISWIKEELTSY